MIRRFSNGVLALVTVVAALLLAVPAHAAPLTLNISGTVDLSGSGGAAVNTFSGFFMWDPADLPFEDDGAGSATYDVIDYSLIFNGADETLPIIGDGTGNGISMVDNVDAFEAGVFVDALVFFAAIEGASPTGNTLIMVAALIGPVNMFSTAGTLPADSAFLGRGGQPISLDRRDSRGGEEDDVFLGPGTLQAEAPGAVPEPATMALTALGLAGALARSRRSKGGKVS